MKKMRSRSPFSRCCAVGIRGLRSLGATVDYLVPNRIEHGYGLSPEIVRLAAARRPDMLITVDNGIAAVEGIAAANMIGIPVLVTDHHLPGETLPDALCIVNPNQPGCRFASKNLAGVGVMFYVLLALRAELRERGHFVRAPEPDLRELLDLVALDEPPKCIIAAGSGSRDLGSFAAGLVPGHQRQQVLLRPLRTADGSGHWWW